MDRDLSDDDSVMDLSFEAESPLAPPAELLERLPSCDWLLQGDRCQIFFPPSEAPGRPQEQRCWSSFLEHRVPVVTEEVAREALLSFVDSKCCYGSAAAGDLVILELKQQALRRYRLETFSESRISEWTFQPFTNHSVDGPQRGTSPRLWDIKVQVPPMFQEDTRKFQVPHSSLVKELLVLGKPDQGERSLSGMPQMPRAWALQVQQLPRGRHGAVPLVQRGQAQGQARPAVSDVLGVRQAEAGCLLWWQRRPPAAPSLVTSVEKDGPFLIVPAKVLGWISMHSPGSCVNLCISHYGQRDGMR
ncbi:protein SSUH2 homolog isoform X2 [Eubalaena glacialis]|uniref:protein SSUH2 homolog isoform X2 n=1 Tax=Eubalaena glacialis TaxID=27606 RepID=UPI002A59B1FE|nr:protein SSUH2 homolog isoform X2 [Eubalaena glacialis]